MLLSADPGLRQIQDRGTRLGRLKRGAIIAAALAHAVVIAVILLRWPFASAPPAPPPPAIAIALVPEVPAPPAPAIKPAAPVLHDLRSGPDQETTTRPDAEAKAPEAAPKSEPQPPPETTEAVAPPEPKPRHVTPPAPPRAKEAKRQTAPDPAQQAAANFNLGDKEQRGDHYLNALNARAEQHRSYPAGAVGSFGLNLAGTAVYAVALSPAGAIEGMRLERSSGSPALDETARKMIEQAAPFPPLPSYYPREGVVITWSIPIYPLGR